MNLDKNIEFEDFSMKIDREIINLTSFMKKESVQKILKENINYPNDMKNNIVHRRDPNILGYEAMIGMAYDYNIRFLYSYKINKNINDSLYNSIGYKFEDNKSKLLKTYNNESKENKLLALTNLSIKLSLNEIFYRTGKKHFYNDYKKETIESLQKELIKILKVSFPIIEKENIKNINFNPDYSYMNIIADGDLLINKTLIDFKVVSSMYSHQNNIEQLLLYTILNDLNKNNKIENIQIYYPRYNQYPIYKVDDLIKDKKKLLKIFN